MMFLRVCGLAIALSLGNAAASDDEHIVELQQRDPAPAGYVAKPWYPAPKGGWVPNWASSYAKARAVVSNMTLAEKVNMTSGTGYFMGPCVGQTGSALRFGIPRICLQDSALGVASTDHNTAFPAGITVGATFDKSLMYQRGAAIGAEHRGKGSNVHLGPTVGPIGRKPRGGRGWEGFGADPVLQAIGAAAHIKGVQEQGVIATIKHFIGNEQEMYRMTNPVQPALSANIDDRTLHELYMWPFAEAVKVGCAAAMTSYNDVNGSAASQNSYLINNLLKDELGFQGFVMSDWFAQIGGVSSALAGLDMAMPGDTNPIPLLGTAYWAYELSKSVLNASVPVDRLNDMVTRVVAAWYQLGQDKNYPEPNFSSWTSDREGPLYPGAGIGPSGVVNQYVDVQADHKTIAKAVARDSITMVKNINNTLPLSKDASLKVFGTDQATNPAGANACGNRACNTGTLGMGWGSGVANYPYLDDPITAIKAAASNVVSYNSDTFPLLITVGSSDIALVFITSDSGENSFTVEGNNGDRSSSGLFAWHNGDKLVQDAASKFSTVIVIIHTVGPLVLERWVDLPSVKAVLFAHLPGQEAGSTLTDILFGATSPNGHLPYTIPKSESDYDPSTTLRGFAVGQVQDTFSDGLYIDYRHFNKAKISPRYHFGYGLSYTTFSFSNASIASSTPLSTYPPTRPAKGQTPSYPTTIPPASEVAYPANLTRIRGYLYPYLDNPSSIKPGNYSYPAGYTTTPKPAPPSGGAEGGNPALWDVVFTVSVTVTNTGSTPGKASTQLYLQYPDGIDFDTPIIQLRDFEKTKELSPGQSVQVNLKLTRKDVSVWDTIKQDWKIPSTTGAYKIWLGCGSGTLRLVCTSNGGGCSTVDKGPVVE